MASKAQTAQPLDALLAALPSLPRPVLARLTTRLIDRLDEIDRDPDLEQTHDEGEPDFKRYRRQRRNQGGPGCQITDPGGCEHDGREPEDGR